MAHKSYSRVARVNHLVQEVVAEEIELIDDDALELVSVTGCEVSADLRHAKVFISALGGTSERQSAIDVLERNRGRIKRALSSSTRLKFLPDLHFLVDPSIDVGFHIEEIINDVHSRGDSLSIRTDHVSDEQ